MDELLYIIIGHNKLQLRDWSDTIMIRLQTGCDLWSQVMRAVERITSQVKSLW